LARKQLNIGNPGDGAHFGSDDIDYINKLLTGVDQSATDSVVMATTWSFNNQKLKIQGSPGKYYIINSSAIAADRNLTLPALTADDTFGVLGATQTYTGAKTFSLGTTFNGALTVRPTAASSSAEIIATLNTTDHTTSYLRFQNTSAVDGEFLPSINTFVDQNSGLPSLAFGVQIDAPLDTGTTPVVWLRTSLNGTAPVVNRKLFEVQNLTTPEFTVTANTIDFHSNTIAGFVVVGYQGSPVSGHQFGGLLPCETDPGEGLLKEMTVLRPDSTSIIIQPGQSTFNTWFMLLTSLGAGQPVGFYKPRTIAYADKNPRLRVLTYMLAPSTDCRFYYGWTDYGDSNLPESDTPLDGTTAGILVGFRTIDTNWQVFTSDGEGTGMQVYDTGVVIKNYQMVDFELKSVIASTKWTINPIHLTTTSTATANVVQDVTTTPSSIPGSQVPLYFHCEFQSRFSDAARQINLAGIEIEVGTPYGGLPT